MSHIRKKVWSFSSTSPQSFTSSSGPMKTCKPSFAATSLGYYLQGAMVLFIILLFYRFNDVDMYKLYATLLSVNKSIFMCKLKKIPALSLPTSKITRLTSYVFYPSSLPTTFSTRFPYIFLFHFCHRPRYRISFTFLIAFSSPS